MKGTVANIEREDDKIKPDDSSLVATGSRAGEGRE